MTESDPVQKQQAPGVSRLWAAGPGIIRGIVYGVLGNKSNSRRLVMIRGRMVPIKEKAAIEYEAKFEEAVWRGLGKLAEPLDEDAKLYFKATVYYPDMRRDLDAELLPDLLQKFNLIKNDRAIWRKEYQRELDKDRPRVEFEIGVIAG